MKSLKLFLLLTFLTGVAYPLFICVVAHFAFPSRSQGSLVGVHGSSLIAQKFEAARYFWPRPSAVDYNALSSGGSNLGPISPSLKKQVEERRIKLLKAHPYASDVPAELLFASGSGLDPHISPQTCYYQLERIAAERAIDKMTLKALVDSYIETPLLGRPVVNVLLLNLALDEIEHGR
jgi:K+-transporting ATPase ATPase C chain